MREWFLLKIDILNLESIQLNPSLNFLLNIFGADIFLWFINIKLFNDSYFGTRYVYSSAQDMHLVSNWQSENNL